MSVFRFNFIAEVVEETAPALVYIQVKHPNDVGTYYLDSSSSLTEGKAELSAYIENILFDS